MTRFGTSSAGGLAASVRSIRFRITAIATVVVGIVLVTLAVLVLRAQERQSLDTLDASLERRADDVISLELVSSPSPDALRILANEAGADAVIQVVTPDGRLVTATANAVDIAPIGDPEATTRSTRTVESLPIEDDRYRLLTRPVEVDGARLVVFVAENTDELSDLQRSLGRSLWVMIPATISGLSLLIWWLVGRTLRPVEAMRRLVADVGASDLDRRVPEPGTGDEIDRLASTMNAMLARLDLATRRQTRFVADASHELRSPLARMRAELEVDLADPSADLVATHHSMREEVEELSHLVDDLLFLASVDSADRPRRREPVDLDDIVLAEVRRLAGVNHRVVDASAVSGASLDGDPRAIVRLVRNLLDNAIRHAATTVGVELSEHDGVVRFAVTDDGNGVAPDDAARIFDRFARLDEARARDDGGTGLGLAIVHEVVSAHGGSVRLDATHRPGARFVVEIPVSRRGRRTTAPAPRRPR